MPNSLVRFEAFLRDAEDQVYKSRFDLNLIVSVIIFPLAVGFLYIAGFRATNPLNVVVIIAAAFIVSIWLYAQLEKLREKRVFFSDPLTATYIEFIRELKKYSFNRSLAERLHPAVARMLEGSAETYFRVQKWLKEPSSKNVLGAKMHKEVVLATQKAMREIIYAIHGAYRPPGMQRKQWQKVIDSDPDALEVCNDLSRLTSLLEQLNEIMVKVQSMGVTITLTDQLRAISEAIEEIEQCSLANIKSLPAPKRD